MQPQYIYGNTTLCISLHEIWFLHEMVVILMSNKVRIRWKSVHEVLLSQEDQIWHQFLKLIKTSLIIHTRWHVVTFPLNKIPIFNVFWPCLTWKWRYVIINWSMSTNDVIFVLPDSKIPHVRIFSIFRSCLTLEWQPFHFSIVHAEVCVTYSLIINDDWDNF